MRQIKGIDKYGYVNDVNVAKQIIKLFYSNRLFDNDNWLKEIDKKLFNEGSEWMIEEENEFDGEIYTTFGGPSGLSSIVLQTLDSFLIDQEGCDPNDINNHIEGIVLYYVDGKYHPIVLSEGC